MLQLRAIAELTKPLSTTFICRRALENSDHYLVEVKRNSDVNFLDTFCWLKISKDFIQVNSLTLKAIDSSYDVEERFFEEGYLKFNAKTGIFIEKFNSGQHQYQLLNAGELSNALFHLFEVYFSDSKSITN